MTTFFTNARTANTRTCFAGLPEGRTPESLIHPVGYRLAAYIEEAGGHYVCPVNERGWHCSERAAHLVTKVLVYDDDRTNQTLQMDAPPGCVFIHQLGVPQSERQDIPPMADDPADLFIQLQASWPGAWGEPRHGWQFMRENMGGCRPKRVRSTVEQGPEGPTQSPVQPSYTEDDTFTFAPGPDDATPDPFAAYSSVEPPPSGGSAPPPLVRPLAAGLPPPQKRRRLDPCLAEDAWRRTRSGKRW